MLHFCCNLFPLRIASRQPVEPGHFLLQLIHLLTQRAGDQSCCVASKSSARAKLISTLSYLKLDAEHARQQCERSARVVVGRQVDRQDQNENAASCTEDAYKVLYILTDKIERILRRRSHLERILTIELLTGMFHCALRATVPPLYHYVSTFSLAMPVLTHHIMF